MIIVANFKETKNMKGDGLNATHSGLRDTTIPNSLADELEKYFSVERVDISQLPEDERTLSHIIGNRRDENVLLMQTHVKLSRNDVNAKICYYHIDGKLNIGGHNIVGAIRFYTALYKHDYTILEGMLRVIPWVTDDFDHTRDKVYHTTNIDRDMSFSKYKDILEQSRFTYIDAPVWLSKRALQACACGTIPIIKTDQPLLYTKQGFINGENCFIFPMDTKVIKLDLHKAKPVNDMAQAAYDMVMANHHISVRMPQIVEYLESVFNG